MICGDINKLYDECISNLTDTLIHFRNDLNKEKGKEILKEINNQGRIIIEKWD